MLWTIAFQHCISSTRNHMVIYSRQRNWLSNISRSTPPKMWDLVNRERHKNHFRTKLCILVKYFFFSKRKIWSSIHCSSIIYIKKTSHVSRSCVVSLSSVAFFHTQNHMAMHNTQRHWLSSISGSSQPKMWDLDNREGHKQHFLTKYLKLVSKILFLGRKLWTL